MDPDRLPDHVARPAYDRARLRPRLAHLGFGAFARAHPLAYLDAALVPGDDWGARVLRLHSGAGEIAALAAQDNRYTLVTRDRDGARARLVGAVVEALHPEIDGQRTVIEGLADPGVEVVTLTVTEKGYCTRDRAIDLDHPDIRHDVAGLAHPRSTPGLIVAAITRRRAAGGGPLTLVSCDALAENGRLLEAAVTGLAREIDAELADWIAAHVAFPSTMADRITPAMTEAEHAAVAELIGQPDPLAVVTEPYSQWVIEGRFAAARPDWERAGAEIVDDVRPHEEMKLRMLDASHSFLAYLGLLSGHGTVAECMADPPLAAAVERLVRDEAAPSVAPGLDTAGYATTLLARLDNPGLEHRLAQIAADGSVKLPQRLLPPILWHLSRGTPWPRLALGVAAWARFVRVGGAAREDPLAERLSAIAAEATADDFLPRLLAERAVFPETLANDPRFRQAVAAAFETLGSEGVGRALAALENGP
jgi:fructuronate reductase